MKKTVSLLIIAASVTSGFSLPTAYAMSNEEFAKAVESHKARIKSDKSFENDVKALCGNLGAARKVEEPKCVALRKVGEDRVYGKLDTSRIKRGS